MAPEPILAALLALPPWSGSTDTADQRAELVRPVAEAISMVSRDQSEAAMLIALAWHETKLARPVIEGRCSEMPAGQRCDNGRARGAFQVHNEGPCRAAYAYPAGSRESLLLEASCAVRLLRGARGRCRGLHPAGDDAGAFSGYGRGAVCTWAPAGERARTMAAVRLRLEEAEP